MGANTLYAVWCMDAMPYHTPYYTVVCTVILWIQMHNSGDVFSDSGVMARGFYGTKYNA